MRQTQHLTLMKLATGCRRKQNTQRQQKMRKIARLQKMRESMLTVEQHQMRQAQHLTAEENKTHRGSRNCGK
jgi:hypothetical protein